MRTKRSTIVAAAVTAALAGGAGAALVLPAAAGAQTSTTTPGTTAQTRANRHADVLKGLVSGGTLTQAQADAVQKALDAARPAGGMGRGPGGKGGIGRMGNHLAAAATALGMTQTDLQTQLQAGKTLAQIAQTKGVAVQKVIDALVADEQSELAAAVKAGQLTQAQADQMKTNLTQRITDMVNGTRPSGGPGGMGMGHGGRGPGGMGRGMGQANGARGTA